MATTPTRDKLWIEAMLTDVDPAVPEVLRVAWLITAHGDRLAHPREIGDQSLATAWSLVSVPLVLTAAGKPELIHQDPMPDSAGHGIVAIR